MDEVSPWPLPPSPFVSAPTPPHCQEVSFLVQLFQGRG